MHLYATRTLSPMEGRKLQLGSSTSMHEEPNLGTGSLRGSRPTHIHKQADYQQGGCLVC